MSLENCRCTAWRRASAHPDSWVKWVRDCGPATTESQHRRLYAMVSRTNLPGWYAPSIIVRNPSGFSVGVVRGRMEKGLRTAKRVADELLADECRSRGFSGRRR